MIAVAEVPDAYAAHATAWLCVGAFLFLVFIVTCAAIDHWIAKRRRNRP